MSTPLAIGAVPPSFQRTPIPAKLPPPFACLGGRGRQLNPPLQGAERSKSALCRYTIVEGPRILAKSTKPDLCPLVWDIGVYSDVLRAISADHASIRLHKAAKYLIFPTHRRVQ